MAKFKIADLHAVLSLDKKGFDADLKKARRALESFSKSASKPRAKPLPLVLPPANYRGRQCPFQAWF